MQKKFLPLVALLMSGLITSCQGGTSSPISSVTPPSTTAASSTPTPISSSSVVCPKEDESLVHLVILAGQSGARGKALNTDLEGAEADYENYDVDIIADGLMMPALSSIPSNISSSADLKILEAGYGDTGSEFGPELGIGQTLASRYPKDGASRRSVIIKYTASGSTFSDHWYSTSALEDTTISSSLDTKQVRTDKNNKQTGPLTNNLYQLIDKTIELLTAEGYATVLDGAAFIHGEQDAKFDKNMDIYEKCLEYFIDDLRSYVGEEEMPVVITEALTNSAKYSNKLRDIQARVSASDDNISYLNNSDLYTNTFEPWHYGAESNFEVGNRIAAELISLNDYREVVSIDTPTIKVPKGVDVELPEYLDATFTNEYTGKVKVEYVSQYDKDTLGEQEVTFKTNYACTTRTNKIKVKVTNEPYVDGVLNEYANVKENALGELGKIYVVKGEEGIYVAAKIDDTDLWTDGENWKNGDMGQNGSNDDFRIYLTSGNAIENQYGIMLSAANLLRIYAYGDDITDPGVSRANMVYQKLLTEYAFRATTKGIVNAEGANLSEGLELEFYIPYYELGIEDIDSIAMCFNYNNVTSVSGKKLSTNNYLTTDGYVTDEYSENDILNYISIANLI